MIVIFSSDIPLNIATVTVKNSAPMYVCASSMVEWYILVRRNNVVVKVAK